MSKLQHDLPDLNERMSRGDFSTLLSWLRDNIYQHGRRYRTAELIERITGRRPHHLPLIETLRAKLHEVHGL